ncbi:MAG TPA: hypothetical protein VME17_00830 [Bryobacteraceae bacterium]|nr:hypothetical protein [Bryobacteraceae bacterium]
MRSGEAAQFVGAKTLAVYLVDLGKHGNIVTGVNIPVLGMKAGVVSPPPLE